jgi:hypothetical protein
MLPSEKSTGSILVLQFSKVRPNADTVIIHIAAS